MNILLVDDEHISNFINKKLIEHIDASINIMEYNDPQKAFRQISIVNPDVIFLDLNMPVMNGWDFLNKMQAEQLACKVVIVTSSVNMTDHKRANHYPNVIGFIEKPPTIPAIKLIIEKVMKVIA